MDSNLLISIIIPIFNTDKYLNQCIDSVINQTYQNIEIILVDDGSFDKTANICDEYKIKDKRVKVIHKKNGGLSDARNVGINNATGAYMMFLDGDDYLLEPTLLEKCNDIIQKNPKELYLGGFKYLINESLSSDKFLIKYLSTENKIEYYKHLLKNNMFLCSAWGKLIERRFIIENDLFFTVGLMSEDIDWIFRVFDSVETIESIPFSMLAYRQNRIESLTHENPIKIFNSQIYLINKSLNKMFKNDAIKQCELSYCAYIWTIAVSCINECGCNKRSLIKQAMEVDCVLDYDYIPMIRQIRLFYKMFGIKLLSFVLSKYKKRRDKRNLK